MKNVFTVLFVLTTSFIFAQSDFSSVNQEEKINEFESFSPKISSNGIYVGLGGLFSSYDNKEFVGFQSRIAYVMNHSFEIGLGGEIFTNNNIANIGNENTQQFYGSLGSLHLKGKIMGFKKIHFSVPVSFGGGAVGVDQANNKLFNKGNEFAEENWDPVLFMDAGVNIEFNINRFIGFEVGGKYRRSTKFDLADYDLTNLNGMSFSAMLKVGLFNFGRH